VPPWRLEVGLWEVGLGFWDGRGKGWVWWEKKLGSLASF
jgi:hypothetical protein